MSFTATRNQVRNPATAMARTFENIHPLSSNPSNRIPVTGMASIPMRNARIHQVQNVHTSPFSKNADSPIRAAARSTRGASRFIGNILLCDLLFMILKFYRSGWNRRGSHIPVHNSLQSHLPCSPVLRTGNPLRRECR